MVATRQFCQRTCKADRVTTENYDLVIIGAGSGNSIIGPEMDGWRIAMVERWAFGGTCLNRGCIPSKMLIYAADLAEHAQGQRRALRHRHAVQRRRLAGHRAPRVRAHRPDRRGWSPVPPRPAERRRLRRHCAHFVGDRELDVGGVTHPRRAGGHRRRRAFVHPRRARHRRRAVPHQRQHHAHRPPAEAPRHPRWRVHRRRAGPRVPIARLRGHHRQPRPSPAASRRTTTSRSASPSSPRDRFDLAARRARWSACT